MQDYDPNNPNFDRNNPNLNPRLRAEQAKFENPKTRNVRGVGQIVVYVILAAFVLGVLYQVVV